MGTLVSDQIPAFYNGVSQQPPQLRLPTQSEEQYNCYSTIAEGVTKRFATNHIAELHDQVKWDDPSTYPDYKSSFENAAYHVAETSNGTFMLLISDSEIKAFDMSTGTEVTVETPLGLSYLALPSGWTANKTFAMSSVGNYTFVTSSAIPVQTVAPPTSQPADWADWYFPDQWGDAFQPVEYYNEIAGRINKGTIQAFDDLILTGNNAGDVWRISGNNEDAFTSYYVQWYAGAINQTVAGGGSFIETYDPGPSGSVGLDGTTMPHALVYDPVNNKFIFTIFPWKVRKVGDDITNPPPTFVGKAIDDVFFYKNRLGFLSGGNLIFSVAGDYGNLFRVTVTDILDSDVIDVAVPLEGASKLRYAVPFNNTMMLFSEKGQYVINVDEILSAATLSIDIVTRYEMDTGVRPIGIGSEVYFPERTTMTGKVREYFISDESNATEAADITAHVPSYLPNGIHSLAGSPNRNIITVGVDTPGRESEMFLYKFHWGEGKKAQSSWSKWKFEQEGIKLRFQKIVNDVLWMVFERPEGVCLEVMPLTEITAPNLDYDLRLDRFTVLSGADITYDSGTNLSTIELPYAVNAEDQSKYRIHNVKDGSATAGQEVDGWYFDSDGTSLYRSDNYSNKEYIGGYKYSSWFEPSQVFVKSGEEPIVGAEMSMTRMRIEYENAVGFQFKMLPYGEPGGDYNDKVLYIPDLEGGFDAFDKGTNYWSDNNPVVIDRGYIDIPMMGSSRECRVQIWNVFPYPARFQSGEWEGNYTKRSRSV